MLPINAQRSLSSVNGGHNVAVGLGRRLARSYTRVLVRHAKCVDSSAPSSRGPGGQPRRPRERRRVVADRQHVAPTASQSIAAASLRPTHPLRVHPDRPARRLVKLSVGRTTGRRVPHVSCARTGHRSFRERKRQAARLCRCEFLRELQCGSRARRQREKQRRD